MSSFLKRTGTLAVLAAASLAAHAQRYTYQYFAPNTPDAFATTGTDLSPAGKLVGWYTNYGNGVWGFSEKGGVYTTISLPAAGSPYTVINAINDGDKILGYGASNGFLLDALGNFTTIKVPASWNATSFSNPVSLNSAGTIVGNVSTKTVAREGFVLTNGVYQAYSVPGSYSTTLNDINDDGVLVGTYTVSKGATPIGFTLANGTLTKIAFPGASSTVPTSINAAGQIVGYISKANALSAFFFDGKNYTQLNPPGQYGCTPYHIKNDGKIVGACTSSSNFVTQAFIATPAK